MTSRRSFPSDNDENLSSATFSDDISKLTPAQLDEMLENAKSDAVQAEAGGVIQLLLAGRVLRMIWMLLSNQDAEKGNNDVFLSLAPSSLTGIENEFVERTLQDFYNIHALSKNPLVHALNLARHKRAHEPSALTNGYALQRALNEALDHFTGATPRTIHDDGLKLRHYLHFRYREEIKHNELADALGYDPRHLRRLRANLIRDFAEVLAALNPPRR